MKNYLLLLAFVIYIGLGNIAIAAESSSFSCGNTNVSLFNSSAKGSPFFVLTTQGSFGSIYYPYLMDREFFELRCDTKSNGEKVILFNYFCGGNACTETNYGIIDTKSGKQLLEPGDRYHGNSSQASELLGHPVKAFSCKSHSKTSKGAIGAHGEYCFISPQELG